MTSKNKLDLDAIIYLKVKGQDQEEVHFKIKQGTVLLRMMEKYIERKGIKDINQVNFLFEGNRVLANSTPAKLGMKNGDEIEVVTMQTGGFLSK